MCACVCNICIDVKLLVFGDLFRPVASISAGGQPREHSWVPNEEGYATTDMETDQLHVPAFFSDIARG